MKITAFFLLSCLRTVSAYQVDDRNLATASGTPSASPVEIVLTAGGATSGAPSASPVETEIVLTAGPTSLLGTPRVFSCSSGQIHCGRQECAASCEACPKDASEHQICDSTECFFQGFDNTCHNVSGSGAVSCGDHYAMSCNMCFWKNSNLMNTGDRCRGDCLYMPSGLCLNDIKRV
jgi:hypothetical protein